MRAHRINPISDILSLASTALLLLFPMAGAAETLPAKPSGVLAPSLQPYVDNHVVAGFVALVADKDNVLDLEAVGYSSVAHKTPMNVSNLFWIASMSKSFTGAAFMILVDEGKVSIDDPVEKYLPEFKGQMVADPKDPTRTPHPPLHPITVREVLSHTSGITQELTKQQSKDQDDCYLNKQVADHAAAPLKREPGTAYEYSNAGINTAGRIIEVVSGMSYADFVRTRLLEPLGMKDTTWWPCLEQGQRLAHTAKPNADKTGLVEMNWYAENKAGIDSLQMRVLGSTNIVPHAILSDMGHGQIFYYSTRFAMPAGGLFSTARDVGIFCRMILNGGVYGGKRYLSEEAIRQMSSDQTGGLLDPTSGYGLGWQLKRGVQDFPSAGSFGHRGARGTHMWIDPATQRVFVLMMEHMDDLGKEEGQIYQTFLKAAAENCVKRANKK